MRKKRCLITFLALCLAISLLPAKALAVDGDGETPAGHTQETVGAESPLSSAPDDSAAGDPDGDPADPPSDPEAAAEEEQAEGTDETPVDGTALFEDVNDPGAYYYEAIAWAVENGILAESGSTECFGVGVPCTRAEVVEYLWRMCGKPAGDAAAAFTDVPASETSDTCQAIAWATENGIVKGFGDGTFRPMLTVSRKDAMLMLYREAGEPIASGSLRFSDVLDLGESVRSETGRAILWATNIHVTYGYSAEQFHPLDDCSREQIIAFIYRYVQTLHTGYATGAYEVGGRLEYYENGVFRPYTGLVDRVSDGKWIYVENGVFQDYTGVAMRYLDQCWYYTVNGEMTEDRSVMSLTDEDQTAGKTEMFVYAWVRALFSEITTPEMSRAEKLKACFNYMTDPNIWKIVKWKRVPHVQGDGWNVVYAMDMITDGGSACHGFSSVFGFLAKLCGYDPYMCYNRNYHSWVEIDGLVYDPYYLIALNTLIYGNSYEQLTWDAFYDTSVHGETWRHCAVPSF